MLSGSADFIFPAVTCNVQVSEAMRGVTFVQAVEVHACLGRCDRLQSVS